MTLKFMGSRTQFELRVGDHHSVDVVLYIRRQDVETMRNNERWDEILLSLQTSILPRMFHDEIEMSRAKILRKVVPPELGPGGIPVGAGEKNQQSRRRRTMAKTATVRARARASQQEHSRDPPKRERELNYAFGKKVKFAYHLKESKNSPSVTFVVDENKKYKLLTKLSKSICLWAYPCDPAASNDNGNGEAHAICDDELLLTAGRPEMIPLASLFRHYPETEKK
jgi:hypothetical protein